MTVERIHPKAPVMLIFIAIFTCLPSCINLSNIIEYYFVFCQSRVMYLYLNYLVLLSHDAPHDISHDAPHDMY